MGGGGRGCLGGRDKNSLIIWQEGWGGGDDGDGGGGGYKNNFKN